MSRSQQIPSPLKVLSKMANRNVSVKLKSGIDIRGVLVSYDTCMNLVIDEAEEYDPVTETVRAKYGKIMIRGSQVMFVSSTDVIA